MNDSKKVLEAARNVIRIAMLEEWLRERARGRRE